MTEKVGIVLDESIGEVEEVDIGKYLRVRVLMNITKPLVHGKMMNMGNVGRRLAKFKYERMLDFCYFCGCLDHQKNDCDSVISTVKDSVKMERLYGTWLRVESAFFSSPEYDKKGPKPSYGGTRSSLKDGGSSFQELSYPVRPLMAASGGGVQGGG
ncbi:hypothetical protein PTKIN_Ptkin14bG0033000 [Pterospermum kingtungense]